MTFVEICVAVVMAECFLVSLVGAIYCIAKEAARNVIAEMKKKGEL
jgi:hypothetical protein